MTNNTPRPRWWWWALLGIWLLSTAVDRLWLHADQGIPSWDQAEYLSSALEHGRGLGLIEGGRWQGWQALLDLSPKIPPLSALISGSVMAIAGSSFDQASWVLSLWHGLLLVVVACWGRELAGAAPGLLAAGLLALAPAMADHRVSFTLDLPLTACSTTALWLLGRWQRRDQGGTWPQAISAALAITAAVLVKQSALLVLAPPAFWVLSRSLGQPQRRWQSIAALALVITLVLPWLHHNWISTLGGTERAVITSGAEEGDPGSLDPRSLLWYPRLFASQLGTVCLGAGLLGWLVLLRARWRQGWSRLPNGWGWLLGCCISGWLFTSLSPNKDPRYIAPVLPLLILLLSQGWWAVGLQLQQRLGRTAGITGLVAGLLGVSAGTAKASLSGLETTAPSVVPVAIEQLRQRVGNQPTTVLIAASSKDFNEQTLSYLGNLQGSQIQVRRLGRNSGQEEIALDQAQWWLLATGDQGTSRKSARALSKRVRQDPRFERVQRWPWSRGRQLELWQRRESAPKPEPLERQFIALARGLQQGPQGLNAVFQKIGPWHLVDPHFQYQNKVEDWARQQQLQDPGNRDALWSLALLAALRNRPQQAAELFERLARLEGPNSWAHAYQSFVLLADWNGCAAARVADRAQAAEVASLQADVLTALRDAGRSFCFDPRGALQVSTSLRKASSGVRAALQPPPEE